MSDLADLFPAEVAVTVRGDCVEVDAGCPELGGSILWTFNAIEVRRKDFDCQLGLVIKANLPGYADSFPATHFSGESASARDTFRRTLDGFYGKELPWAKLLTKAYSAAREAYLSAAQTVDLLDVGLEWEEKWWVRDIWPADGVTMLFGQGSHGKGHLTMALALCVCCQVSFLGNDAVGRGNVLYLDYEGTQRVLARRLNRHILGTGVELAYSVQYMAGRAIAVADQIDAVRRELERTRSKALIVDSTIPALGGDPLKAETVARMFNALNGLGVPVWLLAHVTKGGEEEFPYGSVFFHNLARMTWFIKRNDDEESPDIQVALFNKKTNEGRLQRPQGAEILFDDPHGPIVVQRYDVGQDAELSKSMRLAGRLWNALTVPKTTGQLADELAAPASSVRVTAMRMKGRVTNVTPEQGREATWARVSYLDEGDVT